MTLPTLNARSPLRNGVVKATLAVMLAAVCMWLWLLGTAIARAFADIDAGAATSDVLGNSWLLIAYAIGLLACVGMWLIGWHRSKDAFGFGSGLFMALGAIIPLVGIIYLLGRAQGA